MRDALGCRTVLNLQVVLCATVVSLLELLLSICVTLPIIWRDPDSENARDVTIVENGVARFHSVLLVSQFNSTWHACCYASAGLSLTMKFLQLQWDYYEFVELLLFGACCRRVLQNCSTNFFSNINPHSKQSNCQLHILTTDAVITSIVLKIYSYVRKFALNHCDLRIGQCICVYVIF